MSGNSQHSSRRERILSAAEAEFAGSGFDGARVARIAARAGVNKQLIFHYFGSKGGLFEAVTRNAAARLAVAGTAGGSTWKQLSSLIAVLTATASEQPGLTTPAWRDRATASVREIVSSGQARGYVRDTVESARIAEFVVAACVGWRPTSTSECDTAQSHRERYCYLLAQIVLDYCSWR